MEIGALWVRKSANGKAFMSGVIEVPGLNIPLAVFKNENKQAENHPDYKIVWSKPQEGRGANNGAQSPSMDDSGIPF